jgi:hypothetical protein
MNTTEVPVVRSRSRAWAGGVALTLSTALSTFWAYWGSIENFYEGWYFPDLSQNVRLMAVQYLPWMFIPMLAGLIALRYPLAGAIVHFAMAAAAFWFFGLRIGGWLIAVPLLAIGALYFYGGRLRLRWASHALVGVPVATAIVSGAYPAWIVFTRPSTVDLSMQKIAGNGIDLIWAPAGPGWDSVGLSWFDAQRRCEYLSADGSALAATAQRIWHVPSVDEVARTMRRRGANAGGTWDVGVGRASFRMIPDKEAPLWNPHSAIIYWWTADEVDRDRAYRISYNGHVLAVRKSARPAYLACRCARSS